MSSLSDPVPIIICGRSTRIGGPISELLKPEYEVVHFIQSVEAAKAEIPVILSKRDPQSADNGVGTKNYSRQPRAVILGRAFEPQQAEEIRAVCEGINSEPVVWVVGNPAHTPSVGPTDPSYAENAAKEIRAVLGEWKAQGAVKNGVMMWG